MRAATRRAGDWRKARRYAGYYEEFREYTMLPESWYVRNLLLIDHFRSVPGVVVECGTWKGGMIAGMAKTLGEARRYYLFDSYEGLPDASDRDGPEAIKWQKVDQSPNFYDNCTAKEDDARAAMGLSRVPDWEIVRGWFEDTLPDFAFPDEIAVLRLDGDWYDSTMTCLRALFPRVAQGGIVVIDDYYIWDGCTRAVHDYLAEHGFPYRISQFMSTVAYIQKTPSPVIGLTIPAGDTPEQRGQPAHR